jgi:ERCC4-type nuclease
VVEVQDVYPTVVLVLVRADVEVPERVCRGAVVRLARRGVATLRADDADDAARWIAHLDSLESRAHDDWGAALGVKRDGADRLAEQLVAWLPGVSTVGARRLLEHFGSLRALALADEDDIRAVRGFGPKRARAIADALRHEWTGAAASASRRAAAR